MRHLQLGWRRPLPLLVSPLPSGSVQGFHVPETRTLAGYTNPVGVHALVFAGDWTEASAAAAIAGAKAAGYDMVSRV